MQRRGRLADSTAAASGTAPARRSLDPGKLAAGLRAAALARRRRGSTSTRRGRPRSRRRRGGRGARAAGSRPRAPRAARDERLPAAGRARSAATSPGLRLRAGDRAAQRGPAARRSAGAGARASATPRTSSTTTGCTADDRILWGGYDAVYRFGGPVGPRSTTDDATFARLSQHFFTTFPQLEGAALQPSLGRRDRHLQPLLRVLRHRARRPRRLRRRLHRARRRLDPLGRARRRSTCSTAATTEATRLRYVRRRPVPFPPEPLRTAVIQLTRNRLAAADRTRGAAACGCARSTALGLGFDS